VPVIDYGDAPDTYKTLSASGGPSHGFVPGFFLGATVDGEADGVPTTDALGDDIAATDDEDGVTFTSTIEAGGTATVTVVGSPAAPYGKFQMWVDFDGNGMFTADEQVFTNLKLAAGPNLLSFAVPAGAVAGDSYARARLAFDAGIGPTGHVNSGEVEDYKIVIGPTGPLPPPGGQPAPPIDLGTLTPSTMQTGVDAATSPQFLFTASLTGSVKIDVASLAANGTVDLEVYDQFGFLLGSSTPGGNNFSVSFNTSAGIRYLVKLTGTNTEFDLTFTNSAMPVMANPAFAAGTSPDYVADISQQPHGPQDPASSGFFPDNRWNKTATDGGGLARGDATTLTWGIVPDGTSIEAALGFTAGTSSLIAAFDGIYSSATLPLADKPWFQTLESMFVRWGDLAGVTYVYEPNDDGVEIPNDTSQEGILGTRPDIRIGGQALDGDFGVLAFNYSPENGDLVFDTSDAFFADTSLDSLGLFNTAGHEQGHGLNLAHAEPVDNTKLMETYLNSSFRGPQFHDILAAQRLYGDAHEKGGGDDSVDAGNSLGVLTTAAYTLGMNPEVVTIAPADSGFISIDGDDDQDWYRFDIAAPLTLGATLRPVGPTYEVGPEGTVTTSVDTSSLNNLDFEIRSGTSGEAILASGITADTGNEESVSNVSLPAAGTYYVRVFANDADAADDAQLYALDLTLSTPGPRVEELLVSSTAWSGDFLQYLQSNGMGSGGYTVPVGLATQLDPLPWLNIDQFTVRFSEDVVVGQSDLALLGVNVANYTFNDFVYDDTTFAATWTLDLAPQLGGVLGIEADKLLVDLSENVNSTAGASLAGDSAFRFNVLPGDVFQEEGQGGVTNIIDVIRTRVLVPSSTTDGTYSAFHDIDGSGVINIVDVIQARSRVPSDLPTDDPISPPLAADNLVVGAAPIRLEIENTETVSSAQLASNVDPAAQPDSTEPVSVAALYSVATASVALEPVIAQENVQIPISEPNVARSDIGQDVITDPIVESSPQPEPEVSDAEPVVSSGEPASTGAEAKAVVATESSTELAADNDAATNAEPHPALVAAANVVLIEDAVRIETDSHSPLGFPMATMLSIVFDNTGEPLGVRVSGGTQREHPLFDTSASQFRIGPPAVDLARDGYVEPIAMQAAHGVVDQAMSSYAEINNVDDRINAILEEMPWENREQNIRSGDHNIMAAVWRQDRWKSRT